jgi:chemotaxis protein CheY-P-specific phosphatase CheC
MIENVQREKHPNSYYLENYIPEKVSIYSEGILRKSDIQFNAEKSYHILFKIQGELNGIIVCSFDVSELTNTNYNFSHINALFSESMNILLGNFLTNLEEKTTIMGHLSHPEIISDEKRQNIIQWADQIVIHENLNLQLITLQNTYNCLIEFIAHPLKSTMV